MLEAKLLHNKTKTLFDRSGQFPSARSMVIKTWGRVLPEDMSENLKNQSFDSQMYLPVILTL